MFLPNRFPGETGVQGKLFCLTLHRCPVGIEFALEERGGGGGINGGWIAPNYTATVPMWMQCNHCEAKGYLIMERETW